MKNPFKKDVSLTYKGDTPITPYQRAQQEWDMRIGSARIQARNWRTLAIMSLAIVLSLIAILILVITQHKDRVYVAEVTKEGKVTNVAPMLVRYQPNEAQKEYFIKNFIELTRSLPMDPVLAKKNWVTAYTFLTNKSMGVLNQYFKQNNPISLLGKKTITVEIDDMNPIGGSSVHVDWTETTINSNGQKESKQGFSGVFTIAVKQPTKQDEILRNPLGIYIVNFNIKQK